MQTGYQPRPQNCAQPARGKGRSCFLFRRPPQTCGYLRTHAPWRDGTPCPVRPAARRARGRHRRWPRARTGRGDGIPDSEAPLCLSCASDASAVLSTVETDSYSLLTYNRRSLNSERGGRGRRPDGTRAGGAGVGDAGVGVMAKAVGVDTCPPGDRHGRQRALRDAGVPSRPGQSVYGEAGGHASAQGSGDSLFQS